MAVSKTLSAENCIKPISRNNSDVLATLKTLRFANVNTILRIELQAEKEQANKLQVSQAASREALLYISQIQKIENMMRLWFFWKQIIGIHRYFASIT